MYWPARLLSESDREALFNGGNGLTYEAMQAGRVNVHLGPEIPGIVFTK
jgi:hypothetical protein